MFPFSLSFSGSLLKPSSPSLQPLRGGTETSKVWKGEQVGNPCVAGLVRGEGGSNPAPLLERLPEPRAAGTTGTFSTGQCMAQGLSLEIRMLKISFLSQ